MKKNKGKNRLRRKKAVNRTLALSLILAGVSGYPAHAATEFKSSGRIVYDNRTPQNSSDDVVFDSSDLNTLDNLVNNLDDRLTDMSTSVTKGVEEVVDAVNQYPGVEIGGNGGQLPAFSEIADAIDQVTLIPKDTYFYEEGTQGSEKIVRYKKLGGKYYLCNEKGESLPGVAAVDVSQKKLIDYHSAQAGDLGIGKAGFANGHLYLGDGSDSAESYQKGYQEGEKDTKIGTAEVSQVLKGQTFTSKTGVGLTGTMENRGNLNWNPTENTTMELPAGYYSGGTLDSSGAYTAGVDYGKNTVDKDSKNYKEGYSAGEKVTKTGTATADQVLKGKTFTSSAGVGLTGTMENRGALNWNPTTGTTLSVPAGYYSGGTLDSSGAYNAGVTYGKNTVDKDSKNYKDGYSAGEKTAKTGTATADQVLKGQTFNSAAGVGLTGTMENRGALNWNPTTSTTLSVPAGYYSGGTLDSSGAYNAGVAYGKNTVDRDSKNYKEGYSAGEKIARTGTATADQVLKGQTFNSAAGSGLTGTMENRGSLNWKPTSNTTFTVPAGYYSGGTLDSSGAYNAGVEHGKNTLDTGSVNYQQGYNQAKQKYSGQTGVSVCQSWGEKADTYSTATLSPGLYLCICIVSPNNHSVDGMAEAKIIADGNQICYVSGEGQVGVGTGYHAYRHSYMTYRLTEETTVTASIECNSGTASASFFRIGD